MRHQTKSNFLVRYVLKFFCVYDTATEPPPEIVRIFWVLLSTFACTIAIEATFKYSPLFISHNVPVIIPSWVASLILTCNGLESPFGQPYNIVVGTFICSLLGVILTKLWLLIPSNEDTLWVCGALSASLASVLLTYAQVVHPAACSAALIPVINKPVRSLGWYYLVVQLVTSALVLPISAVFANIYAQYPLYWLLPPKLEDDAANFQDIDEKDVDNLVRQETRSGEPTSDARVSPLNIGPENSIVGGTSTNKVNGDDSISQEGPAPVPYTGENIELQPEPTHRPVPDSVSLDYSLSREPTQEDDDAFTPEAISRTRTWINAIKLRGAKTLNNLETTPSRASFSAMAANTNYLKRIETSTASTMRMALRFPKLSLRRSVIISARDYSIPPTIHFSVLDKGVLVSIQRKLLILELNSQQKRRLSRSVTLPNLSRSHNHHSNNNK